MLNSLDLLIIVFIGLAVATIIGIALQFITKNKVIQKIGFYVSSVLATGLAFCNYESTPLEYGSNIFAGFAFAALAIAAVVLQLVKKDDKALKLARILSVIALLGGMLVTFFI